MTTSPTPLAASLSSYTGQDSPSLQERRQQLRLVLLYKVVEGLVPALPPERFLTPQQPGRLVQARKQADFNTTNVGDNYFRNNDRYFRVPPCHIAQYKNSFFPCTIEWNCPDNSAVNVDSMASFRLLTHQMRNSELCSFSLFISLFL